MKMQDNNQTRKKKPRFLRQEAHKKKKLGNKWRKPRGHNSKMRMQLRGNRAVVKVGYGSPKAERGLIRGARVTLIGNLKDLSETKKGDAILLSSKLGNLKRIRLIKEALSRGLKIVNYADAEKKVKELEESFEERVSKSRKNAEAREKRKKEKERKAREKEEEKKKKEKEEKEKSEAKPAKSLSEAVGIKEEEKKEEESKAKKAESGKKEEDSEKKERDKLLTKRNIRV